MVPGGGCASVGEAHPQRQAVPALGRERPRQILGMFFATACRPEEEEITAEGNTEAIVTSVAVTSLGSRNHAQKTETGLTRSF